MLNPTGGTIRNDSEGQGHYGAKRGARLHAGTDYEAIPGQMVIAPIAGKVTRQVQVYNHDPLWTGLEIVGRRATVQLFYVKIDPDLVGQQVQSGDVIGSAQDIRRKYGPKMIPHIHLQISAIDPECLIGV